MSDKCIRCDWGTALGTAYCAPCLSILVALEHGEQPTVDDPLDAPPERAILQDLIAGLRKSITDVCGDSLYAEGINMDFYFRDQITRAEARLNDLNGVVE